MNICMSVIASARSFVSAENMQEINDQLSHLTAATIELLQPVGR